MAVRKREDVVWKLGCEVKSSFLCLVRATEERTEKKNATAAGAVEYRITRLHSASCMATPGKNRKGSTRKAKGTGKVGGLSRTKEGDRSHGRRALGEAGKVERLASIGANGAANRVLQLEPP